jgi:hypothetical protein
MKDGVFVTEMPSLSGWCRGPLCCIFLPKSLLFSQEPHLCLKRACSSWSVVSGGAANTLRSIES